MTRSSCTVQQRTNLTMAICRLSSAKSDNDKLFDTASDADTAATTYRRHLRQYYRDHTLRFTHTHSVLTAIFPGEPGLASCPLNSPSPFIPGLHVLLGQT